MGKLYIVTDERRQTIAEDCERIDYRVLMVTDAEIGGFGVITLNVPWDPSKHDQVVVLVARHTDGSSFGRSTGNGEVIDAFTSAQEAWVVKCKVEEEKRYGLRNWDTYYGVLESVDLYALPLMH